MFFLLRSTQIGDYNSGDREFGRWSLGAILVLVGILPQRVRNLSSLDEVLKFVSWESSALPLYYEVGSSTSQFGFKSMVYVRWVWKTSSKSCMVLALSRRGSR